MATNSERGFKHIQLKQKSLFMADSQNGYMLLPGPEAVCLYIPITGGTAAGEGIRF